MCLIGKRAKFFVTPGDVLLIFYIYFCLFVELAFPFPFSSVKEVAANFEYLCTTSVQEVDSYIVNCLSNILEILNRCAAYKKRFAKTKHFRCEKTTQLAQRLVLVEMIQ